MIATIIRGEGTAISRIGVHLFLKRFKETGTICRIEGSGRPSKITREVRAIVDRQMELNDETTAVQLHSLLSKEGYSISLPTILRCRSSLGWTFRGSAYCQLIREANKVKRFEWCQANIGDDFENVIFTDECSVQLETHRRFSCRRKGERPKPKPRYK